MSQVVELKRSDKNFLSGIKAVRSRLNEEAKELDWLDKNIELIRSGRQGALKKLVVIDR